MKKTIYDPRYCELTAWLREQRQEKGFTMRMLAKKLDCSYSFIGKYEKNQVRLDILQYQEICSILGVDPCEGFRFVKDSIKKAQD